MNHIENIMLDYEQKTKKRAWLGRWYNPDTVHYLCDVIHAQRGTIIKQDMDYKKFDFTLKMEELKKILKD